MKKAILIVAALVLVLSGVAAVSAYEAHVVNVKAHVENVLYVTETELDFGVVFPEEWLDQHFDVTFSESWYQQDEDVYRVRSIVDFEVWAEDKEILDGAGEPTGTYYPWLGDCLFIEINGTKGYVGPATDDPLHAQPVLDGSGAAIVGTLETGVNQAQTIKVWIDVPVFEEFYNELTDVPNKPRADWADALLVALEDFNPDTVMHLPSMILPLGTEQGIVMGVDIKIQVVSIR